MTKAIEALGIFISAVSIWLLLLTGAVPTPAVIQEQIVPVLPYWALVSFGAYALATLGWDVLTFNDKPEKFRELMGQIDEAKTDLRSKGIAL